MVEAPGCVFFDPTPLVGVHHQAAAPLQHPSAAGIYHYQPRVAEVPVKAPTGSCGLPVRSIGELAEERSRVVCRLDLLEEVVPFELPGREVAEVLVDPVGGVRADDLFVPPGMGAHLLDPGLGDVP